MLVPSYSSFLTQSAEYFVRNVQFLLSGKYSVHKLSQDLTAMAQQVALLDLLVVTGLSIALTFTRHYSTERIFKVRMIVGVITDHSLAVAS